MEGSGRWVQKTQHKIFRSVPTVPWSPSNDIPFRPPPPFMGAEEVGVRRTRARQKIYIVALPPSAFFFFLLPPSTVYHHALPRPPVSPAGTGTRLYDHM